MLKYLLVLIYMYALMPCDGILRLLKYDMVTELIGLTKAKSPSKFNPNLAKMFTKFQENQQKKMWINACCHSLLLWQYYESNTSR